MLPRWEKHSQGQARLGGAVCVAVSILTSVSMVGLVAPQAFSEPTGSTPDIALGAGLVCGLIAGVVAFTSLKAP